MGRVSAQSSQESQAIERERANTLIALMDSPSSGYTSWEQGFIAALTWIEVEVEAKIRELADRLSAA